MSQSSSASSFSSAGGSQKTSYNKHFPRSFLLNYGGALQDLNEEAVLSRLHDFNCEWLQRPNIALRDGPDAPGKLPFPCRTDPWCVGP